MSFEAHPSKQATEWLTAHLTDSELYSLITNMPDAVDYFFKGFQITRQNAGKAAVRRRFAREISRRGELFDCMLNAPSMPWGAWQLLLGALEQEWLLHRWRSMARTLEGPLLVMAMAADSRQPVRQRAIRMLRRKGYWQKELQGSLRDLSDWKALATLFHNYFPVEESEKEEVQDQRLVAKLQRRLEVLQKEKEKVCRQIQKEREALRDATVKAESDRAAGEQARKELREELHQAREELSERQQHWDLFMQQEVQAFRQRVLGVTPELERLREKLLTVNNADLSTRVREVLKSQQNTNEKHGIKSDLREQLHQVQQLRSALKQSVEESVVVLPETRTMHAELRTVEKRLSELLQAENAGQAASEMESELLTLIKIWPGDDYEAAAARLMQIEEMLQQPVMAEMLKSHGVRRLGQAVLEKRRLLEALQADDIEDYISVNTEKQAEPREIWHVADALQMINDDTSIAIFVDGYNVIHRVQPLALRCESENLAAVRRDFCLLCSKKAGAFTQMEIVFDGTGSLANRQQYAENLAIVFSAHREESQNADRYITDRIHIERPHADRIWLVTDDYGLRRIVSSKCDAFVKTDDFYQFLMSAAALPGNKPEPVR